MAQIIIETTKEERDAVLKILKELKGATTPVATIASMASMKPSRARYVLLDLIQMGLIEKVPTKAFNKHYVRYGYKVL